MNNEDKEYLESDWKLFRTKIVIWQENYMKQLCLEYINILKQDQCASEKLFELNKRMKKDLKSSGVVVEMSRSKLIYNINRFTVGRCDC